MSDVFYLVVVSPNPIIPLSHSSASCCLLNGHSFALTLMDHSTLMPPSDGDVILSHHYMAGIIVMTVLAILTVLLRMYTRMFVSHQIGWDDWTMFAASV
jgi:hypothetical protein